MYWGLINSTIQPGPSLIQLSILYNFFFYFNKVSFSFYHNKIHWVTSYKDIKNKINKTRQHRTNKEKQTNKQTNKTKPKRKQDEITRSRHPSFSFWTEYQSIIWSIECHFFNNLSLLELDNSFSIFLILLIVIFKLSKFNCLVFLAL